MPLVLIVGGQRLSYERLSEVRVLAHESQMRTYLDAVSNDVQHTYLSLAESSLTIPFQAVQQRRFDELQQHFVRTTRPGIKQLFVGVFEDCSCKTQYFDPARGSLSLVADPSLTNAVLRVSVPWRVQQGHMLTSAGVLVDRQDPNNRILYRIVTDEKSKIIGVVGLVIDSAYFEKMLLPGVVQARLSALPEDVRDNLIVNAVTPAGAVLYASYPGDGQRDTVSTHFDLAFDDLSLRVMSRHLTAGQLAASSVRTQTAVALLMGVVILIGVGLSIRAERRAMRLSQLKSEFVSNVTHELRTPLSSIALIGELLRLGHVTSEAKVREYGGRIETESYRLQQTVTNILDIARIESSQRQYSTELVPPETLVTRALRAVDLPAAQKGFTVHYTAPSAPMPPVMADARAISDAIVSVIDNAMKYSGTSRDIHVRLEEVDGRVGIRVTDRGIGIAAADQARIFDKFYRVSDGPAAPAPGTGLGLAIVKHAVEAHKGSVVVTSTPGAGSTFAILLPAHRAVTAAAASPFEARASAAS